jgi:Uma2 family endonuclease
MGETEFHVRLLLDLLAVLLDYFRNKPSVYVGANMFVYYTEGEPRDVVAPDLFIVFGVPKRERRIFKVWEEGKAPDVVIELTSASTRLEDLGTKKELYAELGVREYFIFDPLGEYLHPTLRAYRLVDGELMRVNGETVRSEILGLELRVEGNALRLYHPVEGKLLTPLEAQEARRNAEAARRAAEAHVLKETQARQTAEAELEKLRAELERLKGEK